MKEAPTTQLKSDKEKTLITALTFITGVWLCSIIGVIDGSRFTVRAVAEGANAKCKHC